jgi:hygromycin-B 4-O-kinase
VVPVTDAEAEEFLAGYYGTRAAEVRVLGAGDWSRAYSLVLDGREAVIRFGQHAGDFRKDQVMASHSCAALPVPQIIEIGAAGGGYFAVSERAFGEGIEALDGHGMRAALPGLLAVLDAVREIDVAGTSGYGIWAPEQAGPAPTWAQALLAVGQDNPRLPGWRAALAASSVGTGVFDRAYARLQQLTAGLPGDRHLVHGDLLRNVLVRGPRITAVFDWANSLYGDWLYDAAWLIFCTPWFPALRDIDMTAELRQHWDRLGITPPGLQPRLQACLLHIGLGAMAYNAYRRRRDDLALSTAQTAKVLSPPTPRR